MVVCGPVEVDRMESPRSTASSSSATTAGAMSGAGNVMEIISRLMEENTALREEVNSIKEDMAMWEEVASDVESKWKESAENGMVTPSFLSLNVRAVFARAGARMLLLTMWNVQSAGLCSRYRISISRWGG